MSAFNSPTSSSASGFGTPRPGPAGPAAASASSSASVAPPVFNPASLYAEPLSVLTPTLKPLSYRIPLHKPRKAPSNASAGDDDPANPAVSGQPRHEQQPSHIHLPQTPGFIPTTPGNTALPPHSALPAPPPWRVRWHTYVVASPSAPSEHELLNVPVASSSYLSKPTSTPQPGGTPNRPAPPNPSRSAATTPGASSLTPGPSHAHTAVDRIKGKGRARADSTVSSASKRQRTGVGHPHRQDNPASAPFFDPENPVARLFAGLRNNPTVVRPAGSNGKGDVEIGDPLRSARNAFLFHTHGDSEMELHDRAEPPSQDMEEHESELPQRLAYIEASGGPDLSAGITRKLWLFSLMDVHDVEVETTDTYDALELSSSGTFGPQDLFPSLYNDNSIYASPASRPAKQLACCLQLTSTSNVEAIEASELFARAVRDHLLRETLEKSRPDNAAPGVLCGAGLIWPPLLTPDVPASYVPLGRKRALYLTYDVHYDHLGIVASAFLHPMSVSPINLSHPPSSAITSMSPGSRKRLHPGDPLILCPVATPATFIRWYALESAEQPSKKMAEREASSLESMRKDFEAALSPTGESSSPLPDDSWLFVRVGECELVWPASHALFDHTSTLQSRETTSEHLSKAGSTEPNAKPEATFKTDPRALATRKKRAEQLADLTSAHIERHSRERERERREKAERALSQQHSTGAATPTSIATPTQLTTPGKAAAATADSPAFAGLPMTALGFADTSMVVDEKKGIRAASPTTITATMPAKVQLYNSGPPNHSRFSGLLQKSAHLKYKPWSHQGAPTLASIAALLPPPPPLTPSKQKSNATQPGTVKPGAHLTVPAVSSRNEQIYPTPQSSSAAQSVDQTVSLSSSTFAVESKGISRDSVPGVFDDFMWNAYPSTANDFGSNAQSITKYGGVDASFFDSDMFDSGLTEDDFSFFDTPALPLEVALPQSLPQGGRGGQLPVLHEQMTYDTTAGTIDHFSHLMPTGDSPSSNSLSNTSPVFLDHLTPSTTVSSAKPPSLPIYNTDSPFGSAFAASPLFMADQPALRPTPLATLETISEQQSRADTESAAPALAGTVARRPRYAVELEAEDSSSRHNTTPSALSLRAFTPLRFSYLQQPMSRSTSRSRKTHQASPLVEGINSGLIDSYRSSKARALQSHLSGRRNRKGPHKGSPTTTRDWLPRQRVDIELVFDDTSSESEESQAESIVNQAAYSSIAHISSAGGLGQAHLAKSLFDVKDFLLDIMPTHSASESILSISEKGKFSKGEKEALATVFFQQFVENAELRSRAAHLSAKPTEGYMREPLLLAASLQAIPGWKAVSDFSASAGPKISVHYHSAIMEMSTAALGFWSKMGLKPASGPKDVRVFCLAASSLVNDSIREAVEPWLECISRTYQNAGLGQLRFSRPAADESSALLVLECPDRMLSFITDVQDKLPAAGMQIARESAAEAHAAVYLLVEDEECRQPSSMLVQLCLRLHLLRRGLIPHIIPISLLSERSSALRGATPISIHKNIVSRLAFALYDRLSVQAQRFTPRRVELLAASIVSAAQSNRTFPAPAFKLASKNKQVLTFSAQWPPPTLGIMDRHRLFHVGYATSSDFKWLFLAAIDEKGEHVAMRVRLVEGLDIRLLVKRVWSFAKELGECVNVEWRVCITRADSMGIAEVQAWNDLLASCFTNMTRPMNISINCIGPAATTSSSFDGSGVPRANPAGRLPEPAFSESASVKLTSFYEHPVAVYNETSTTLFGLPQSRKRKFYSLASSVVGYAPKSLAAKPSAHESSGYSVHVLLTASHPLSTYPRPLGVHLHDLTQSFLDLQVLAQERWSLAETSELHVAVLPWHLLVVRLLSTYDISSLVS